MSKAVKTARKKAKKKAVQKARTPKKSQPVDLRRAIFQKLRAILSEYSPPLAAISDVGARYELVSDKEVEWAGRQFKQFYFGAAIIQSNYAGLHLMHVYVHPDNRNKIPAALLKCLKGKACFHIKTTDNKLMKQIERTVSDGFKFYEKVKFV